MHKLLLSVYTFLFLGLSAKAQSNINKEKIDQLSKEAAPLFLNLLLLQSPNKNSPAISKDSVRKLGDQVIAKYLEIYELDTTRKSTYGSLGDCYRYIKNYKKAIFWYRHSLINNENETSIEGSCEFIAISFISLGELDSSMHYIKMASSLSEKSDSYFNQPLLNFKGLGDQIYNQTDQELISLLIAKGIKPCLYSIEILKRIIPYTKTKKFYSDHPLIEIISDRTKKCL